MFSAEYLTSISTESILDIMTQIEAERYIYFDKKIILYFLHTFKK